jgi:hypothetical protein
VIRLQRLLSHCTPDGGWPRSDCSGLLLRARPKYNQTVGPDETIEESGWWLAYDDDMPEA